VLARALGLRLGSRAPVAESALVENATSNVCRENLCRPSALVGIVVSARGRDNVILGTSQ
jgi:hypothetical protein